MTIGETTGDDGDMEMGVRCEGPLPLGESSGKYLCSSGINCPSLLALEAVYRIVTSWSLLSRSGLLASGSSEMPSGL